MYLPHSSSPAHRDDKDDYLHGIAVYPPFHVADAEVLAAGTSVSGSGRQHSGYLLSSSLRHFLLTPSDDFDGNRLVDIEEPEENNEGSGERARL